MCTPQTGSDTCYIRTSCIHAILEEGCDKLIHLHFLVLHLFSIAFLTITTNLMASKKIYNIYYLIVQ